MAIKPLRIFGHAWLTLATLLISVGMFGIWLKDRFSGVQEVLSPFNLANWFLTVITVAPGVGALAWAEKTEMKRTSASPMI